MTKLVYISFFQTQLFKGFNHICQIDLSLLMLNLNIQDSGDLNCGVPQCSILEPLLFHLYVNDVTVECELLLYGDDSVLLFICKNVILCCR